MSETDEAIYQRYLAEGSEEDLRTLLERYREGLTLFAYGIVRNMEDAEEVMLDAFAVASSGTVRFEGRSSFRTWLFSIARKQAVSRMRRRRFLLEPLSDEMGSEALELDFQMLGEERNRQLYKALDKLAPDYHQALYLLYFEEMTPEEAARVMHKSVKQVYNLAHRGRQSLKDTLMRMGFSDAQL